MLQMLSVEELGYGSTCVVKAMMQMDLGITIVLSPN